MLCEQSSWRRHPGNLFAAQQSQPKYSWNGLDQIGIAVKFCSKAGAKVISQVRAVEPWHSKACQLMGELGAARPLVQLAAAFMQLLPPSSASGLVSWSVHTHVHDGSEALPFTLVGMRHCQSAAFSAHFTFSFHGFSPRLAETNDAGRIRAVSQLLTAGTGVACNLIPA